MSCIGTAAVAKKGERKVLGRSGWKARAMGQVRDVALLAPEERNMTVCASLALLTPYQALSHLGLGKNQNIPGFISAKLWLTLKV